MDTTNKFGVGVDGVGNVSMLMPPRSRMSKDDAIMLAAYLVLLADDPDAERLGQALAALSSSA